ncbi:HTTM domain-containing protein [Flavobacterium proteolyticum]|uniref:HTTM domain-containing protein n=1 Tax=Flavobacterium proteolyticum TaxID=2911683 RepID=A0ABR9WPT8_9FLAO|nr:HTTM domain-containing protein [Flavobacterium proteolyticum]MBE9575929.1 HTTM domain-containing protein [Flavobacterium proteolyticum]
MKILFQEIDNSPLIVFRIFFGFLVACESFGAILTGWVKRVFIDPQFTFTFIGFEWLQPFPGNGMYFYFITMGIFGLAIMLGYRYRIAIISYTFLWAGVYFMQKTAYNNHYYLLLLISFLLIFLPANRYASLDVKQQRVKEEKTMPYWISLLFIVQIAIVYVYASIAKFYPDWLDGTFTRNLLVNSTEIITLKKLFLQKWFYLFIAYMGIIFDLLIVPLLLFKRTRIIALIASLSFHLFNAVFLEIGIFPFFALTFALFFYEPEAIRRIFLIKKTSVENENLHQNFYGKRIVYFLMIPYIIIQLILPLRHHFIEGDVLWTEEGHRLSWRMMLRERNGYIIIRLKDLKTGKESIYNYGKELTEKQALNLAAKPDFIWQYCQRIKEEYKGKPIAIYIDCKNSINRKEYKTLIDPKFDMASAEWSHFKHNEWIVLH